MKPFITIFLFTLLCTTRATAQTDWPSPEIEQMYNTAHTQLTQGNTEQAIILYQQAIKLAPDKMILYRDLADAYHRARNYKEAMAVLDPIIKRGEGDDQCYQLYASCLIASGERKKSRSMLEDALKRYPNSGVLLHEMGIYYEADAEPEKALEAWLNGIEKDPEYYINYYEAARTYMGSYKPVWAVIYAEIFLNMEGNTPKADEAHDMLLGAYMRLFNSIGSGAVPKYKDNKKAASTSSNGFEEAVYDTYVKLSPVVSDGITTENLTMLRTRFMMSWQANYANKYPFTLFSSFDDMLRYGNFDAYNQWLFGIVDNPEQFEAWKSFHGEALPNLGKWMAQHPFKPIKTDFYNDKVVKNILIKEKPEEKGKK